MLKECGRSTTLGTSHPLNKAATNVGAFLEVQEGGLSTTTFADATI
jgi:hypothetical protein